MKDFFMGFFRGLGNVVTAKIVGPIQVIDLWLMFTFGNGIYLGWGNTNALCGWGLAAWFYLIYRVEEEIRRMEDDTDEETLEVLKMAHGIISKQSELIEDLHKENDDQQKQIEALKNRGAV